MVNRFNFFAAILSCLVLCGCSDSGSASRKPVYPTSGTVEIFGAPLAGATVAFAPLEGQPTAFGSTDADGKFVLTTYDYQDGAAAGKFKVIVTKTTSAAAKTTAEGADHEAEAVAASSHDAEGAATDSANLVPAQYANATDSPLNAEVKSSGENVFNFDLK